MPSVTDQVYGVYLRSKDIVCRTRVKHWCSLARHGVIYNWTIRMNLQSLQANPAALAAAASTAMSTLRPHELRLQWQTAFSMASPSQRLTLVYFANEICQRCRKSKPEFLSMDDGFAAALPDAFRELSAQRPDYKDKLKRVVEVWGQRNVFESGDLDMFRRSIAGEIGLRRRSSDLSSSVSNNKRPRAIPTSPSQTSPFSPSSSDFPRNSPFSPPFVDSGARATSSSNLDRAQEDMLLMGAAPPDRASSPGSVEANGPSSSWLLEIVALARDVPAPPSLRELFQLMGEAERDSVKFELDQDKQDRLVLRLFRYLKQLAASPSPPLPVEDLNKYMEMLRETRMVAAAESEEAKARADALASPDLYELVESHETFPLNLKTGLAAIEQRSAELELETERDQQILVGIAETLESMPQWENFALPEKETESEVERLSEIIQDMQTFIANEQKSLDEQKRLLETPINQLGSFAGGQPSSHAFPSTTGYPAPGFAPPAYPLPGLGGASLPPLGPLVNPFLPVHAQQATSAQPDPAKRPRKQRWGDPSVAAPPLAPLVPPVADAPWMGMYPPTQPLYSQPQPPVYPPPPALPPQSSSGTTRWS